MVWRRWEPFQLQGDFCLPSLPGRSVLVRYRGDKVSFVRGHPRGDFARACMLVALLAVFSDRQLSFALNGAEPTAIDLADH